MLRRFAFAPILAAALLASSLPAGAAANAAGVTVLTNAFSTPLTLDAFSSQVVPAITAAQVAQVNDFLKSIVASLGPFVSATPADADNYALAFKDGTATALLQLDAQNKIANLFFRNAEGPRLTSALNRLLKADFVDAAWFAPSFLAQIPANTVQAVLAQNVGKYGAFKSVEATKNGYVVHYANTTVPVQVFVDGQGRITLLQFPQA
ncbi:MAG: hypothetical protein JO140_01510 [Candidatus Eremiobacteraeota bacterium]|nr:hypothetical protein [Candidatus Eremiobacteraeota bacterium]